MVEAPSENRVPITQTELMDDGNVYSGLAREASVSGPLIPADSSIGGV